MLVFSPLPSILNAIFPLHSLYVFPSFLNACSKFDNVIVYSAVVAFIVPGVNVFVISVVSTPSIAIFISSTFKLLVILLM